MSFFSELLHLLFMTYCMVGYLEYTRAKGPKDPVSFIVKKWNKINSLDISDDILTDLDGLGAEFNVKASASAILLATQDKGRNFSTTPKTTKTQNEPLPKVSTKKNPWAHINSAVLNQKIPEIEEYYKRHTFDLNERFGQCETTLLHGAVENSKYKAAIWLLKKGANVSVKNKEGKSSWEIFSQNYLKPSKNDESAEQAFMRLMISRGKDPL